MGIFNVIGSLQNLESAEAAGDKYNNFSSLAVNGIGSIIASFFGSTFPTTIYIGHPGWKKMGARAGYSILNGIFITIICLTGLSTLILNIIPLEAGMGILLWIGIIHAYKLTPNGILYNFNLYAAPQFVISYLLLGILFYIFHLYYKRLK